MIAHDRKGDQFHIGSYESLDENHSDESLQRMREPYRFFVHVIKRPSAQPGVFLNWGPSLVVSGRMHSMTMISESSRVTSDPGSIRVEHEVKPGTTSATIRRLIVGVCRIVVASFNAHALPLIPQLLLQTQPQPPPPAAAQYSQPPPARACPSRQTTPPATRSRRWRPWAAHRSPPRCTQRRQGE
jgi:hypothetical protein